MIAEMKTFTTVDEYSRNCNKKNIGKDQCMQLPNNTANDNSLLSYASDSAVPGGTRSTFFDKKSLKNLSTKSIKGNISVRNRPSRTIVVIDKANIITSEEFVHNAKKAMGAGSGNIPSKTRK